MAKNDVVDKYTVKFAITKPYAPCLAYVASPWTLMFAREVEEKWGELTKPKPMVGTLPSMFKSHTPNVELVQRSRLRVPPPAPNWGGMLSAGGRRHMLKAHSMVFFHGVALSMAIFGFNMLGDALRDVLDRRLRGR